MRTPAFTTLLAFLLACGITSAADAIADGLGKLGTMRVSVQVLDDKVQLNEGRPDEETGSVYFADFALTLITEQGEKIALTRKEAKWPDVPEAGSRGYAGTITFHYPNPKPDLSKIKSVIISHKKNECTISVAKDGIRNALKKSD